MTIKGMTAIGQVTLSWLVTLMPQALSAVTVEVLVLEQLVGAR